MLKRSDRIDKGGAVALTNIILKLAPLQKAYAKTNSYTTTVFPVV